MWLNGIKISALWSSLLNFLRSLSLLWPTLCWSIGITTCCPLFFIHFMIFRAAVKGVVLYAVNRTLCSVYSEMLKVMTTSRRNRLIYREWDKSLGRWRGGGLCRRWVVSMLLIIVSCAWSTGLCLITTTLWLLGAQQEGLKFRKKKKPLSKNALFLENINNSFPPCSHLSCFLGFTDSLIP